MSSTYCASTDSPHYLPHAAVHGVRFLAADRLFGGRSDRCFWTVSLFVSAIAFVWCASGLVTRLADRPIVVSLAERAEPIWNVAFPAITICPETKALKSVLNFTDVFHRMQSEGEGGLDAERRQRLESILQVCDSHMATGLNFTNESSTAEIYEQLQLLAPKLDNIMLVCQIKHELKVHDEYFSEVWTEDGLCFTYNILNTTELYRTDELASNFATIRHNRSADPHWNSHHGYNDVQNRDGFNLTYPFRAHSAGQRGSLIAILQHRDNDTDHLCRGPTQGFKVIVHAPDEAPIVTRNFFRVSPDRETMVTVRPVVTETAPSLRRYDSQRRQCLFSDERRLRFFRTYTQHNCETECLSEYLLVKCGCTRFSLPHNESALVCGASKVLCMADAETELLNENMMDGLTNSRTDCNCLPACTSVSYEVDVSNADMTWKEVFQAHKSDIDHGTHLSRLTIMFKDGQFTPTVRYELYSNVELIALFGGLLALFFGASVLSLVEVVYVFVWKRYVGPGNTSAALPHRIVAMDEFK